MFSDPERAREARLFSRPRMPGAASIDLVFEPAADNSGRVRIAERLIRVSGASIF